MKQNVCSHWLIPLIVICLTFFSTQASAVIETYEFDDESLNERYHQFTDELRCPMCQNQNLSGSNSPIAKDLRRELHRLLQEGKNDQQVVEYMVDRYGEFILYRPRFNTQTALLWIAPAIFLILGLFALTMTYIKQRRKAAAQQQSDEDLSLDILEQEKLKSLLGDGGGRHIDNSGEHSSEVSKNG